MLAPISKSGGQQRRDPSIGYVLFVKKRPRRSKKPLTSTFISSQKSDFGQKMKKSDDNVNRVLVCGNS